MGINQLTLHISQADLKHAQIASIFAIHQMSETRADDPRADRHAPDVQKYHRLLKHTERLWWIATNSQAKLRS
jgi:hypothetical protein